MKHNVAMLAQWPPHYAVVGSRTTLERSARGVGVSVWRLGDPWTLVSTWAGVNPSFLIAGPRVDTATTTLYTVHGDGDAITRLVLAADGGLTAHESRSIAGRNPVHLAVVGDWLVVVNHSGSLVTLPMTSQGHLGEVVGRCDIEGVLGPHRTEQAGPKPHQVVPIPGTDLLLVPDKGLDTVFTVQLCERTGALKVVDAVRLREGSGPRHVALHPRLPLAYTIDELNSSVTVLSIEGSRLTAIASHSTLKPSDVRDSRGAEIMIVADRLFASNRSGPGDRSPGGPGEDTIACFDLDADGSLHTAGWLDAGGIRPRFMTAAADSLVVALERSDAVVSIPIGQSLGANSASVCARTGSPVCVVLV